MSPFHKKIVEVLEGRYGVSPVFAEQFVPVFDQVAQSRPSSDDWEQLMECVAAAYRALPQVEDKALHEAQILVGQFVTEMKKIGADLDGPGVLLRVNPDIARALKEEERGVLKDLKSLLGRDVIVKSDVHLHHEQFDVMSIGG
jgi:hypothetical protein